MPAFDDDASQGRFASRDGGHEACRASADDDEICVEIHIIVEISGKDEKTLFI